MDTYRTFQAHIDQLRTMLKWIEERMQPMGFDPKTLRKIELASEEALVNVIVHAYQEKPELLSIGVKAFVKSHVEIVIEDKGPPFNPLDIEMLNKDIPMEERAIGGLGVHFIKKNMDEVRYRRHEDTNILTLIKKAANQPSAPLPFS